MLYGHLTHTHTLVPHIHVRVSELVQHWFRSWFVTCSAPSYYLDQCWLIVNSSPGSKLQWNFNQSAKHFINENASENIVCEMAAILPRGGDELIDLSLPFQLVPLTVSTKDSSQNSGPRSRNQQKRTVRSNSTVPPSASSKQKSASHRQNNQQTRPSQFRSHKPVLPAATSNQEPPSHQQSNQQIRTPILRWWLVICQMRFKIRFTNMLLHSLSPLPHNSY